MIERIWLAIAGGFGAAAVGADAAARHLLAGDPVRLDFATTAGRYGLWHALALIGVVLLGRGGARGAAAAWLAVSGWCYVAGLVLFCGGLMLLAAGAPAGLTRLVPVGGLALIAGWTALFCHALSPRRA